MPTVNSVEVSIIAKEIIIIGISFELLSGYLATFSQAFEPTMPKAPTITCETVVPTSYDLPDPRHQCTYLYGRALPYRQCQAVPERGAWCAGHYAAVYRPDTAYERAA